MPRKRPQKPEYVMHIDIVEIIPDQAISRYECEIKDVGAILWFCHYLVRYADNAGVAAAAKRLSEEYVDDLVEHMRRVWPVEASAKPKKGGAKQKI
jgi:hypothetical protein